MSTSLLYHGFGVRGYTQRSIGLGQGEVTFGVEQQADAFRRSG